MDYITAMQKRFDVPDNSICVIRSSEPEFIPIPDMPVNEKMTLKDVFDLMMTRICTLEEQVSRLSATVAEHEESVQRLFDTIEN